MNGNGNNKHTALHWASSWRGHPSVVTTLAEAGANLKVQGNRMETAFCGLANAVVELIRVGTGADVSVASNSIEC